MTIEEHPWRAVAEAFVIGAWFAIQTSSSPRGMTARVVERIAHRLLFATIEPRSLRGSRAGTPRAPNVR